MPTYLAPGVYVEEVSSGSRPIEGAGTAVAAFVGLAEKGPVNEPTLCSNWTQFVNTFGGFGGGSYLAHAVYGYYLNGGGNCFIVRIGGDTGATPAARGELGAAPALTRSSTPTASPPSSPDPRAMTSASRPRSRRVRASRRTPSP